MVKSLSGKVAIVTGGSRGIGFEIASKLASEGAQIVILTRDTEERIKEATNELLEFGGEVLIIDTDVSNYNDLTKAMDTAMEKFKAVDILVNNTSATCFTNTLNTSPKDFDLVMSTSVRAAFFMAQICLPYLRESQNPHIINISPPLLPAPEHIRPHLPFSMAKYAMSLCTMGLAVELKEYQIAVNSLWPETTIATPTIQKHFKDEIWKGSRWPRIMGDAAHAIAMSPASDCSGHFYTDEEILRERGVDDFSSYQVDPKATLIQSLFMPLDESKKQVSSESFLVKNK